MYLWEDFTHTWSASILQSWPARKSRNGYFFSLVAFAMGWEAHPLPHRELIYAREIGKIGQGQAFSGSSL